MKKIAICFIVGLSLSIIACGRNQNAGVGNGTVEVYHNTVLSIKQYYDGIDPIGIEEKVLFQIRADLDKAIEKRIQMEYEDETSHDYGSYLNKIWILNEWKMEDIHVHDSGFSFYITRISKGKIEGNISTGRCTVSPNYYTDSVSGTRNYPEFSGSIFDGKAKCYFKDRQGNEGMLEIELIDENHVTASVEYIDIIKKGDAASAEGQYNFRPYNLSDEENWKTVNVTVERDMGIWGNVRIVGGIAMTGRVDHGFAYLVNENGDIFYEFGAPFRTGAQIVDIYTEDYNRDGRMDVKFIEQYCQDDTESFEWLFLQREDGTFDLKKDT